MGGGLSKRAKAQISLSKKTGGTELNLSDCKLMQSNTNRDSRVFKIFNYFFKIGNIHKIGSFKSIVRLKLLRRLILSRNFLTVIPSNVKNLINLEELDVSFNQVQELPTEICTLANLKILILEGNLITALPNPSQWGLMTSLQVLNLSSNRVRCCQQFFPILIFLPTIQITTLTDDFTQLRSLTSLSMGQNGLVTIPPQVYRLSWLKNLDVSGNSLNLSSTEKPSAVPTTYNIQQISLLSSPRWSRWISASAD